MTEQEKKIIVDSLLECSKLSTVNGNMETKMLNKLNSLTHTCEKEEMVEIMGYEYTSMDYNSSAGWTPSKCQKKTFYIPLKTLIDIYNFINKLKEDKGE